MTSYRRLRVQGGTYFFTVNLVDRRSDLLVREIGVLRGAVARATALHPFTIDAWWCCQTTFLRCGRCRRVTAISRCGER